MFSGPVPKVPNRKSGPNFMKRTPTASTAEAKPKGMPIASSTSIAISRISEIVEMSNIAYPRPDFSRSPSSCTMSSTSASSITA